MSARSRHSWRSLGTDRTRFAPREPNGRWGRLSYASCRRCGIVRETSRRGRRYLSHGGGDARFLGQRAPPCRPARARADEATT